MSNEFLNKNIQWIPKSWGGETIITNTPLYCGKDLFIKKDKQISLHYHKLKDETFLVQSGTVDLVYYLNPDLDKKFKTWDDLEWHLINPHIFSCELFKKITLKTGDVFHIPVEMRHTLYSQQDSHVFEFSTQHFDEDSYRILNSAERN